MSKIVERIVLGTVQFGVAYGRTAQQGPMAAAAAEAVLDAAWELGIRRFDTAVAYGCAQARLAGWLRRGTRGAEAQVVTKVQVADTPPQLLVERALAPFRSVAGRSVLTHGPCPPAAWGPLQAAVAAAGAAPGLSVYTPAEAAIAAALPGAVLVQAPLHVLDTGCATALRESPTALHGRSVFLQGLLLETPEMAEARVPGAGIVVSAVRSVAEAMDQPLLDLLIGAAAAVLRDGDALVIGVDDPGQLEAIVTAGVLDGHIAKEFRRQVDAALTKKVAPDLLDPRRWPPTPRAEHV